MLDADIQFGTTDAAGNYTTPPTGYPNTVKVTVRRDATANSPLGAVFRPGLRTVQGQPQGDGGRGGLRHQHRQLHQHRQSEPEDVAHHLRHQYWNTFLATGADPDGNIATDSSGSPQLNIYPSIKDTGNFGLISLDGSHSGASTISSWIDNGLQQSDVQGLTAAGGQTPLIPLSQHNSNILPSNSTDGMGSWNWVGNPGMKTSVLHTLSNYTGERLFCPCSRR